MTIIADGRWGRYYLVRGQPGFLLCVTYHKQVKGRSRQLTISPKLAAQVRR